MVHLAMSMTATRLRKQLFTVLDEVGQGEPVELVYKGSTIRIIAATTGSKLARAKRQHALLVDPDSIVASDVALNAEIDAKLLEDWPKS